MYDKLQFSTKKPPNSRSFIDLAPNEEKIVETDK